METKLTTHACFGERFKFVFHISCDPETPGVWCRAELYEHSQLKAVLELVQDCTRTEIAEAALNRCIKWAQTRIRQEP